MSKSKSLTIGTSGDAAKAHPLSTDSTDAVRRRRIDKQLVQNILLIWLDNNIDENSTDCRNKITQLRCAVNSITIYTDVDQCVDFLTDIYSENVCMIVSGALYRNILPLIHNVIQLHTIFILCENKAEHNQSAKDWFKIKDFFTEILPICEELKKIAQQYEQNAIPISFIATNEDVSKKTLDQLNPLYMYTQILKEILLSIEFEEKHFNEFIDYCRDVLAENSSELKNIDKLQRNYRNETPIWWYTYSSFLYSLLNRALRLMDTGIIIQMGFFIGDLHRYIKQLHKEQFGGQNSGKSFTVYRGQGMSKSDFEQMKKNKGGLISFNNFLSTSKNRDVSVLFAEANETDPNLVGILFVMTIDSTQSTTPFACITDVSYFEVEDEVLFSMHTIFRIYEITPMTENHRLFQVNLTLTSDNDQDLRRLTNRIREETSSEMGGWLRLGLILLKVGQFKKAQQVYEILLEQTTDESEKGVFYNSIGWAKHNQREYNEAIAFYEKALEIGKKILPSNHPDMGTFYNNIGGVYYSMGEYSKALSYYEKALRIRQQSLSPDHPALGMSCNNIGMVYDGMGEYSKALSYYEKALKIQQQSLPPNHPDLAMFYISIGDVYSNIGEYSKALSYFEKALKIRQQSLPPDHPLLAMPYTNIGLMYRKMGEYSKALSYYEKDLETGQKRLPSNHPDLATCYSNVGAVYYSMGEYSQAILYNEKAFEIRQQSLPPNHLDLGMSYNNIGLVYYSMGEYSKTLPYYDKALKIRQKSLPPNHPDLGMSYNNIGSVYYNMGEYLKALSYYEKALQIRQQSLPPNHPDLAMSYIAHGIVYHGIREYPKAIVFYEKALKTQQQSLGPNHPELIMSYNNIGLVYQDMGEYSKALSSHEKALDICKTLSSNHPALATSYHNIGVVYFNMGECSKALSYYEQALQIRQKSLPPNHPDLSASYNNIGSVYQDMGQYSKALSFYGRAVEIGQQSLPTNHPHLQLYRENLERLKTKL